MGWRSTKVVKSVDKYPTTDYYLVPSKLSRRVVCSAGRQYVHSEIVDSQWVEYEFWRIHSTDGFEIVIDRVDPMNPPKIESGSRYTGWWK